MPEFHLLLISLHAGFKGTYLRCPMRNFRFLEVKLHSDTITTETPFFKNQIPEHSIAFRWRERGEIEDVLTRHVAKRRTVY